jgi:hypothetical protein
LEIASTGRVGVGDANPDDRLTVLDGDARVEKTTATAAEFRALNTQRTWAAGVDATGDFTIEDETGTAIPFRIDSAAPADSLFIEATTGDIGIGTITPTDDLEVSRAAEPNITSKCTDANCTANFTLQNDAQRWQLRLSSLDDLWVNDVTGTVQPFKIEAGAPTDSLVIESTTGDIGMGTSPTEELEVQGADDIFVRVEATGADSDVGVELANDAQVWQMELQQITFSDSLVITDVTGASFPFVIGTGAPSASILIEETTGDVGMGTGGVVNADLEVERTSDTVIMSGCTNVGCEASTGVHNDAQFWYWRVTTDDHFVATTGSVAPLTIQKAAPADALVIEATTGDVGLGASTVDEALHVERATGAVSIKLQTGDASVAKVILENSVESWDIRNNTLGQLAFLHDASVIVSFDDAAPASSLVIGASGDVTLGDILSITPKATAPASCSIGDFYVDTDGAACACSATDTWSNMHGTGTCS